MKEPVIYMNQINWFLSVPNVGGEEARQLRRIYQNPALVVGTFYVKVFRGNMSSICSSAALKLWETAIFATEAALYTSQGLLPVLGGPTTRFAQVLSLFGMTEMVYEYNQKFICNVIAHAYAGVVLSPGNSICTLI